MAKFQGGLKEAAKMLAGLTRDAQKKILSVIAKKDPQMASLLEKNLYTLDDLKYLTPTQFIELLRAIKVDDLGLALRLASPELKEFVFNHTPKAIRLELQESLAGPLRLASHVTEAEQRILKVFVAKIEKGELVLHRQDTLV